MLPGGALCAEAPGPGEEDDMRRYQTEGSRRLHQQTVPYLLDGGEFLPRQQLPGLSGGYDPWERVEVIRCGRQRIH